MVIVLFLRRLPLEQDEEGREFLRRILTAELLFSFAPLLEIYINVLARARERLTVSGASSVFKRPKCVSLTEVVGSFKDMPAEALRFLDEHDRFDRTL